MLLTSSAYHKEIRRLKGIVSVCHMYTRRLHVVFDYPHLLVVMTFAARAFVRCRRSEPNCLEVSQTCYRGHRLSLACHEVSVICTSQRRY